MLSTIPESTAPAFRRSPQEPRHARRIFPAQQTHRQVPARRIRCRLRTRCDRRPRREPAPPEYVGDAGRGRWARPFRSARVGLELGDPRGPGRAGDLEGDLAQGGAGEADGPCSFAGGQLGAGVAVEEPPGLDGAGGVRRLADDDRGDGGGGGPLDRGGAGGADGRPVGVRVAVTQVAVARSGGLAGSVGTGSDAEVGPGGRSGIGRSGGRVRRSRRRVGRRGRGRLRCAVSVRDLQALAKTSPCGSPRPARNRPCRRGRCRGCPPWWWTSCRARRGWSCRRGWTT